MRVEVTAFREHQDNEVDDEQEYDRNRHDESERLEFKVHEVRHDVVGLDEREHDVDRIDGQSLADVTAVHQNQCDKEFQGGKRQQVEKYPPDLPLAHAFVMLSFVVRRRMIVMLRSHCLCEFY